MGRQKNELLHYEHQELMDRYNDIMISIKVHLYDLGHDNPELTARLKLYHAKPMMQELDKISHDVIQVLKTINKPMRRY